MSAQTLVTVAIVYFMVCIVLPVILAVFLYNVTDNPMDDPDKASFSYISLFVARQFVGLATATTIQCLTMIIVLALAKLPFPEPAQRRDKETKLSSPSLQVAGSMVTSLIMQSGGWPLILFWWSIFDMIFLKGSQPYHHHWLHFQDALPVFNDSNPSGNLVENAMYSDVLRSALFLSIMVSVKRFFIRMHLDQQTYHFYGLKLAVVTHKIVILLEVVGLDTIENRPAAKAKLDELLFQPPEKSIIIKHQCEDASIRTMKQFQAAWALLQEAYSLKADFCQKSEKVASEVDQFVTNGREKTYVNLVKAVHDEYRLLQAIMDNASQIDHSFEKIVNVFFYVAMAFVIAYLLGFNAEKLFLSLSGVVLSFAFVFGSASSNYFEGLLFILVRRPYDIGDLVEVDPSGPSGELKTENTWRVGMITLFYTAVVSTSNNVRASWSNGSLANSRVVNWTRSPVIIEVLLRVPLNARQTDSKTFIDKCQETIKKYTNDHSHEWHDVQIPTSDPLIVGDYKELCIKIQHRASWQELEHVLDNKAKLSRYCKNQVAGDFPDLVAVQAQAPSDSSAPVATLATTAIHTPALGAQAAGHLPASVTAQVSTTSHPPASATDSVASPGENLTAELQSNINTPDAEIQSLQPVDPPTHSPDDESPRFPRDGYEIIFR